MLLLGTFATLALLLAGVGLYGVMSYLAAQRTHEIGVRIALGKRTVDILRLATVQGISLALAGTAAGMAGALALTRLMSLLLFGVGAHDPAVFIGAPLVMLAVAFAASYFPAHRAARVDPVTALRHE